MKKLLMAILALGIAHSAFAQTESSQPKHIISIGSQGFGWSGIGRAFDVSKSKSGRKDYTESDSNFNFNYSYVFASRWMIGGEVESTGSTVEYKKTAGGKYKQETSDASIALTGGFNFNEDLFNSWWIQAALGSGNFYQKTKDTTTDKYKYGYGYFSLRGGRRISLKSWGLANVSYNPSIDLTSTSFGGDRKDDGIKGSGSLAFHLVKIDILF